MKFFSNRLIPGFTSTIISKPLSSQSIHSVIIENDVFPPFCVVPKDDRIVITGGLQFPSKDDEICKPETDTLLEKFTKRFPQYAQIQVESASSEAVSVTIDNGPLFGRCFNVILLSLKYLELMSGTAPYFMAILLIFP